MAQGTRGRLALLGTGLLFCLGCMESEPKPIGKKPLGTTGTMGSTVKPNQTQPNTTYGSGVQPASFNTTGRTPSTGTFGSQTVPGPAGTGTSMAPPGNIVPQTSPSNFAPLPVNDPYAGGRPAPTYPPTGYENPQPPIAPGGPSGAFPMAPTAPPGSVRPY